MLDNYGRTSTQAPQMAGETRQPADHAAHHADRVLVTEHGRDLLRDLLRDHHPPGHPARHLHAVKDLITAIGRFTRRLQRPLSVIYLDQRRRANFLAKSNHQELTLRSTSDSAAGLLLSDTVTPPCRPGAQTGGEYVTGYPLLRDAPDREAPRVGAAPSAGRGTPGQRRLGSSGSQINVMSGTIGVRSMVWTTAECDERHKYHRRRPGLGPRSVAGRRK